MCTLCVIFTTFIIRINFKPDTDKIGKKTRKFATHAKKMGYSLNYFYLLKTAVGKKKVDPEDPDGQAYIREQTVMKGTAVSRIGFVAETPDKEVQQFA